MFDFISGKVSRKTLEYVVINVGGVGFKITTTLSSLAAAEEGREATFYTYMSVKEDDISLFGFGTEEERSCFELLLSVNGVGPKMAIAILSQLSSAELSVAVAGGNYKAITKAKGVGTKLAQRIVLELKDKLKSAAAESEEFARPAEFSAADSVYDQAVEALTVLGWAPQKAKAAVGSVYENGMMLEDTVKKALKAGI